MKRIRSIVYLALILVLFVVKAPVSEAQSSTGPVLIVYSNSVDGKFGSYLGEILHAEGLNTYDMVEISTMNAVLLSQYPVVILGKGSLTAGQASDLSAYVNGGGRLIAMQPDAQIKGLFGLNTASGQQVEGYLKIINGAVFNGQTPGSGLTAETLQNHGNADRYTTSAGAVVLAELYSDASTPSGYPAVVGRGSGSGWAVAFTYDLPKNVIYTRQGNPLNANTDLDGDGIVRTMDLFQGSPRWLDLNKVPIPQADEQQRLLSRLVKQLSGMPLPQLWYFPGLTRTVLVITSDAHADPTSYYTPILTGLAAYGAHDTFYLSPGAEPDQATVDGWIASGHSIGIHPYPKKLDATPPITNLTEGYAAVTDWYNFTFTTPWSPTVRHHTIGWQGWTDPVDLESSYGIRMDTNFYHWGPWLKKLDGTWPHGYITGSGLPMKFVNEAGTILPVYQQGTQLVDEQLISTIYDPGYVEDLSGADAFLVSKDLIDASQNGFYSALMTQFHVGYYGYNDVSVWGNSTMAYAQSLGIPMWNADEWLAFVEKRDATLYQNIAWNAQAGILTFSMNAPTAPGTQLSTFIPASYDGYPLVRVKVDGSTAAYTLMNVNGNSMAFVTLPAGAHTFDVRYRAEADLAISMTDAPDPVTAGNQITYSIQVDNAGPDAATNVTVSDTLPAGTSFASATPSQGSCSGTVTVACNLGGIPSGGGASISLVVNVSGSQRSAIANSATVSATSIDSNSSNNQADTSTTVEARADMGLTMTDLPDPVSAGANLVYTLTATNYGPSTATGIVVTQALPAGVTYQSYTGANWSCSESTPGTVTCTRAAALGALASDTLTVTVKVAASQASNLSSTAGVDAVETDTNAANDSATAATTVNRRADMGLTMTDLPDPVSAGANLVYTLTATNNGPSTATGIVVTQTLPAGVTYQSYTGANWSCSEGTPGTVTCTRTGTLGALASDSLDVTVKVAASQASNLSSTATVDAVETDPNAANDSATAATTVNRRADMGLTMTDLPDPVSAGANLVYTLTATNNGPSTATGIVVTQTLPAGVTYQSYTGANWSCSEGTPGTVTCTRTGSLGVLASDSLDVTVKVAASQASNLSSTASVDAVETDPNAANDSATAATTVNRRADMGLTMTDLPDPVVAGTNLVYTLTATNNGPSTATGIVVTQTLPAGVTYQSYTGANWSCSEGTPGTVTCTRTAALGALASDSLDVTVKVAASQASNLSSTAGVDAVETDTNAANDSATAATTVNRRADMGVTMTDLPDPVVAGANLVYTPTVTNNGPSTATSVSLTLALDAGVGYQSYTGANWSCVEGTPGTVTCTRTGSLGVLASDTLSVTVKVDPVQINNLSTTASVSAAELDLISGNNQVINTTTVERQADVSISLSDAPDPLAAGSDLTYTLSIKNVGPSSAESTTINDVLPAGVVFKSYVGNGWTCQESLGTFTCDPRQLPPGYDGTLSIVVTSPNEPGTLENHVSIQSTTPDPDSSNNSDIESTTVTPSADLSIALTADADPARAGSLLQYTMIVANLGVSSANSVVVNVNLPAGSVFESALGTGWICNYAAGTVTCTMDPLAVGQANPVTIKIFAPRTGTSFTTTATVSSASGDPVAANNSVQLTTTLQYMQFLPLLARNP